MIIAVMLNDYKKHDSDGGSRVLLTEFYHCLIEEHGILSYRNAARFNLPIFISILLAS